MNYTNRIMISAQPIMFCAIILNMIKQVKRYNGNHNDNNDRPPLVGRNLFY